MKLKEIIDKLDKTNPEDIYCDSIFQAVDVDWYSCKIDDEDGFSSISTFDELKYYWLVTWYCTDSWVGIRVYFLRDELVAISYQQGRKAEETFEWVSMEHYTKVKDYLQSFVVFEPPEIDILDLEKDVEPSYSVEFTGQLLDQVHKKAILDGEREVEILVPRRNYGYSINQSVVIRDGDTETTVELKRLSFPFNIVD
jgi:hypothetical protein